MIPEKTIERLSRYRSVLTDYLHQGNQNIYSYELARMMNTTPAQIRQDIMNIGYSGSPRKGYVVKDMIECIGGVLDADDTKVVLVGAGNLGKAVLSFFGKRPKLSIVAVFENDINKIDRVISGVHCYHISSAEELIPELGATVGIIASTGEAANDVKDILIRAGIKALLNFTPTPIIVPPNIYVEELNITAVLEKVAYYAKHSGSTKKL